MVMCRPPVGPTSSTSVKRLHGWLMTRRNYPEEDRAELYREPPQYYPKRAPSPAKASSSFFFSSSAGFSSFFLASAGAAAGAAGGAIIIELADFRASSMLTSDNAATRALTWASSACPPAAETIFLTFSSFTGCAHE